MISGFITISGWIFGITSVVLSVYWHKRKQLSYNYTSNALIDGAISAVEGITITHEKKEIKRLSLTCIEIYNSGNTIIEEKDFHTDKGLKISFDNLNAEILTAIVSYQSSDTIKCIATVCTDKKSEQDNNSDNIVRVDLKAIERKERLKINVYHTGGSDAQLHLEGKIKEGTIVNESERSESLNPRLIILVLLSTIASILSFITTIIIPDIQDEKLLNIMSNSRGILAGVLASSIASLIFVLLRIWIGKGKDTR